MRKFGKVGKKIFFLAVVIALLEKVIYMVFKIRSVMSQGSWGRALTQSETLRRVVIIMSTYEELSLIVNAALLIIAILNYTHKK